MTKTTKTTAKPKRISKADKLLDARFAAILVRVAACEQKIKTAIDRGLLRGGNNGSTPPRAADPAAESVNK